MLHFAVGPNQRGFPLSTLPSEIELPLWGSTRVIKFTDTDEMASWAKRELEAWTLKNQPMNPDLKKAWGGQIGIFERIIDCTTALSDSGAPEASKVEAQKRLRIYLSELETGGALTTEHPAAIDILRVSRSDPDAGAMLMTSVRSKNHIVVAQNVRGHEFPLAPIARIPLALATPDPDSSLSLQPLRDELALMRNAIEADLATLREYIAQTSKNIETNERLEYENRKKRIKQTNDVLERVRKDWDALKKVYDTDLALLAPTSYWKSRRSSCARQAIGFGVTFLAIIFAALYLFVVIALPHLNTSASASLGPTGAPSAGAVLLLLIPVLVPAFVTIWILKILGRLFSDNVGLMRDASERQTMVLTFLALMKDGDRESPLVTDQDRILILHALFRPSAVAGVDDSPPVHWFDLLASKVGDSKGSK